MGKIWLICFLIIAILASGCTSGPKTQPNLRLPVLWRLRPDTFDFDDWKIIAPLEF